MSHRFEAKKRFRRVRRSGALAVYGRRRQPRVLPTCCFNINFPTSKITLAPIPRTCEGGPRFIWLVLHCLCLRRSNRGEVQWVLCSVLPVTTSASISIRDCYEVLDCADGDATLAYGMNQANQVDSRGIVYLWGSVNVRMAR
jgi:hypothetical protein